MGETNEKKYPDLPNTGFLFLDDHAETQHPKLLPQEVLLPSSPPRDTIRDEKKYPNLTNTGFPSLDNKGLVCLMTPTWLTEVPLPPSIENPYPAERKYLDLSVVAFPCLGDDICNDAC